MTLQIESFYLPALMQALLFGYAATYDVNRVDYAILDQSNGQVSHELISKLDGSGIFKRIATLQYTDQIKQVIDSRQALVVIMIPSDFESKLNKTKALLYRSLLMAGIHQLQS